MAHAGPPQHLKTANPRHQHIEQHAIEPATLHRIQSIASIRGRFHHVPKRTHTIQQNLADVRIVVHDENSFSSPVHDVAPYGQAEQRGCRKKLKAQTFVSPLTLRRRLGCAFNLQALDLAR